jgi:hypothetical protein
VVEELKLENGKSEEGKDDLKFGHYTKKKKGAAIARSAR